MFLFVSTAFIALIIVYIWFFHQNTSENYKENVVMILGSGSYLLKNLNLDGRIIPSDNLLFACDDFVEDVKKSIVDGEEKTISIQSVVNALMCINFIQENPMIDNFFSQREMKNGDGKLLYPQLWYGFALDRNITYKFLVEIGTGEVKLFFVTEPGSGDRISMDETSSNEMYKDSKFKIEKFYEIFEKNTNESIEYLCSYIPAKFQDMEMIFFGTEKMRNLKTKGITNRHIQILSHREEAELEYLAAECSVASFNIANFSNFTFEGSYGWGNGSSQGIINSNFKYGIYGLKKLQEIAGSENGSKTMTFTSQQDYENAIEKVRLFLK